MDFEIEKMETHLSTLGSSRIVQHDGKRLSDLRRRFMSSTWVISEGLPFRSGLTKDSQQLRRKAREIKISVIFNTCEFSDHC
jgi:hypothetical protein